MPNPVKPIHDVIPAQACLARQPILNAQSQIVAYELLFRQSGATAANVTNNIMATYSVIINTFMNFGFNSVLGSKTAFINIDSDFLQSEILWLLPKDRIVFEILETVEIDEKLIATLKELREQKYTIALDDFIYNDERAPLIDYADIIKIDLSLLNQKDLIEHVDIYKKKNKQLLAEKVENVNQFELCKSLGFTLFQGYFFAKPTTLLQKEIPVNQVRIIQIMNKLTEDVDNEKLVRVICHDLSLTYKLLKLVNSAAINRGKDIESIDTALNILGRKPLYRWLSLLLYLSNDGGTESSNVLFELAIYRGRLLEICGELSSLDSPHELFVLGSFSYLDVLLKQTFPVIFKDLVTPPLVRQALLGKTGSYHIYIELTEALDDVDIMKVETCCKRLNVTIEELNNAQLSATVYCESFNI